MSVPVTELLCVVGPTAVGKTALAAALAGRLDGEVVSCDSMQVYRGMDIGTAKPTAAERGGIPHHMLDVAEPWEDFSAARYAAEAAVVVEDILARGRRPIVAGGTGLYLRALTEGLHEAAPDDGGAARERWKSVLAEQGQDALHTALRAADPETAARLSPGDTRRVLRALEVFTLTGVPLSRHHAESKNRTPRYRTRIIGLSMDRPALCARIDARVDEMVRQGLPGEVKRLLDGGLSETCTAMQAIGYKEMAAALAGRRTVAEAAEAIKLGTRQYAKRQMTWFRRQVSVWWLDAADKNLLDKSTEIAGKFNLP